MYFNKNNNFFHGIMFHHFHDDKVHKCGQGSISKDDLFKMINFIGRQNILDASEFIEKFTNNTLKENDVCFTFDDGIKCQIDVALEVLDDRKIEGFFFVYTSLFRGKPGFLEIFRFFRLNFFKSVDEFYFEFFKILNCDLDNFFNNNSDIISNWKKIYPIYSLEDIKFRLVRDKYLDIKEYNSILFQMFEKKNFKYQDLYSVLFMKETDLKNLNKNGHQVGLHTHNHPTSMEDLSYDIQYNEYKENYEVISDILNNSNNKIKSMSHPFGSYNNHTLKILSEMGILIGFRDDMFVDASKKMSKINNSRFEIAREDHSLVMRLMNK